MIIRFGNYRLDNTDKDWLNIVDVDWPASAAREIITLPLPGGDGEAYTNARLTPMTITIKFRIDSGSRDPLDIMTDWRELAANLQAIGLSKLIIQNRTEIITYDAVYQSASAVDFRGYAGEASISFFVPVPVGVSGNSLLSVPPTDTLVDNPHITADYLRIWEVRGGYSPLLNISCESEFFSSDDVYQVIMYEFTGRGSTSNQYAVRRKSLKIPASAFSSKGSFSFRYNSDTGLLLDTTDDEDTPIMPTLDSDHIRLDWPSEVMVNSELRATFLGFAYYADGNAGSLYEPMQVNVYTRWA